MELPVVKQLCVNHIELPQELLDIVKSYAFDDTIRYASKIKKRTIHNLIQSTQWSGQYRHKNKPHYSGFIFWIEEDINCTQYQMYFCPTCGNYTSHYTQENDKIECKC